MPTHIEQIVIDHTGFVLLPFTSDKRSSMRNVTGMSMCCVQLRTFEFMHVACFLLIVFVTKSTVSACCEQRCIYSYQ